MLEWRKQRDAMAKQIFGLKQNNAKLQENNATLQQDNEALASQNQTLQQSNEQLTNQNSDVRQQVADLRSGETQATEVSFIMLSVELTPYMYSANEHPSYYIALCVSA